MTPKNPTVPARCLHCRNKLSPVRQLAHTQLCKACDDATLFVTFVNAFNQQTKDNKPAPKEPAT